MEGLTVGRIVHYVLESGRLKGDCRPAIVVRNWSNHTIPGNDGMVNLQVFTDGLNDGFETAFNAYEDTKQVGVVKQIDLIIWRTSVHYDETKEPGTWHWPERS